MGCGGAAMISSLSKSVQLSSVDSAGQDQKSSAARAELWWSVCRLAAALLVCLQFPGVALSQQSDQEWPCIQQLVENISPVVMWPLPVDDALSAQWQQDETVSTLAEQLGDLHEYGDDGKAVVEHFASGIPDAQKEHKLSLLAVGILDVSNRVRRHYISGIKRYTRQQIAIAEQISNTLNELSVLGDSKDVDTNKRDEILATLQWHERVYDQREQAIRSLCEQPVDREEVLSDILRDVARYLP
jgi:hypothetical protein